MAVVGRTSIPLGPAPRRPDPLSNIFGTYVQSMLGKKKSDTADLRSIMPTMMANNMVQQDPTGGMQFGGERWKMGTGGMGNLSQMKDYYSILKSQKALQGDLTEAQKVNWAKAQANKGLTDNVTYMQKIMSPKPEDRQDALRIQEELYRHWYDKINIMSGSPTTGLTKKTTPLPTGVSEADIALTMKKHGLTREEVLQRI